MPFIPELVRQRRVDPCDFQAFLVYIVSSRERQPKLQNEEFLKEKLKNKVALYKEKKNKHQKRKPVL